MRFEVLQYLQQQIPVHLNQISTIPRTNSTLYLHTIHPEKKVSTLHITGPTTKSTHLLHNSISRQSLNKQRDFLLHKDFLTL